MLQGAEQSPDRPHGQNPDLVVENDVAHTVPGPTPSASRTGLGSVVCPFAVIADVIMAKSLFSFHHESLLYLSANGKESDRQEAALG